MGQPGLGKTTILQHVARVGEHVWPAGPVPVYVNAKFLARSDTSLGAALASWLRERGLAGRGADADDLDRGRPGELTLLQQGAGALGRPLLVVIDDLEALWAPPFGSSPHMGYSRHLVQQLFGEVGSSIRVLGCVSSMAVPADLAKWCGTWKFVAGARPDDLASAWYLLDGSGNGIGNGDGNGDSMDALARRLFDRGGFPGVLTGATAPADTVSARALFPWLPLLYRRMRAINPEWESVDGSTSRPALRPAVVFDVPSTVTDQDLWRACDAGYLVADYRGDDGCLPPCWDLNLALYPASRRLLRDL